MYMLQTYLKIVEVRIHRCQYEAVLICVLMMMIVHAHVYVIVHWVCTYCKAWMCQQYIFDDVWEPIARKITCMSVFCFVLTTMSTSAVPSRSTSLHCAMRMRNIMCVICAYAIYKGCGPYAHELPPDHFSRITPGLEAMEFSAFLQIPSMCVWKIACKLSNIKNNAKK